MEPRARAGKNVGKETFPAKEIAALMYSYGDVSDPLQESVKVMDDILTEYMEGVCFEASRHAQVAGRQKLKFDDFEFALRRNPQYLGRIRNMFDKRVEIKAMRKAFQPDDDSVLKNQGKDGENPSGAANNNTEEVLGDLDDDAEILETIRGSKKRKKAQSTV